MRKLMSVLLAVALVLAAGTAIVARAQATEEKPKEEKKEKKDKKKKSKAEGTEPTSSETDIRKALTQTLRDFTNGYEGQMPRSALDAISSDRFYDYPRFEDGVEEFLRSAGELRIFTRQVNVQLKDDRAVMIVDAEMQFSLRSDPSRSQRRSTQITFDFQRTAKGWKITEINPRSFFLP